MQRLSLSHPSRAFCRFFTLSLSLSRRGRGNFKTRDHYAVFLQGTVCNHPLFGRVTDPPLQRHSVTKHICRGGPVCPPCSPVLLPFPRLSVTRVSYSNIKLHPGLFSCCLTLSKTPSSLFLFPPLPQRERAGERVTQRLYVLPFLNDLF